MTHYKIHSIKDTKKLSFIIEGENERIIQNKLSQEGHIVLSIEETQPEENNFFLFKGKKENGETIEGRIGAPDLFEAYTVLHRDYGYDIEEVYPESVQDPQERKKIFQDLISSAQEMNQKIQKNTPTNTSDKKLLKEREGLEKLLSFIQANNFFDNKNILVVALKRLSQSNNVSSIRKGEKLILKDLLKRYSSQEEVLKGLAPFFKEKGIFIPPPFLKTLREKIHHFYSFSQLLFTSQKSGGEIRKDTTKNTLHSYFSIHKNHHIHQLLHKKYEQKEKKYTSPYFYIFWRRNHNIFLLRRVLLSFLSFLQKSTFFIILYFCFWFLSPNTNEIQHVLPSFWLFLLTFLGLVIHPRSV